MTITLDPEVLEDIEGTCMPMIHEDKGMVYVGNFVDGRGGKIGHTSMRPWHRRPSSQGLEVLGFIPGSSYSTEKRVQAVARSMGKTQKRCSRDIRWRDEFEDSFTAEDFSYLESQVPRIREQEAWAHVAYVYSHIHGRICGVMNDPRWRHYFTVLERDRQRAYEENRDRDRHAELRDVARVLGEPDPGPWSPDFRFSPHGGLMMSAGCLDFMVRLKDEGRLIEVAEEWEKIRGRD